MRMTVLFPLLLCLSAPTSVQAAPLDAETFAARFEEDFYDPNPSQVKSVEVEYVREKEFILENLVHLPALTEFRFRELAPTAADYQRIAKHGKVTRLEFSEVAAIAPESLSVVKSLQELYFYQCPDISWPELAKVRGTALKRLDIQDSGIDRDDLEALAKLESLEALTLSSMRLLNDDDLAALARFKNLSSLSVYNSSSRGRFLEHIKGKLKLREFNFTGGMAEAATLQLANIPSLRALDLNLQEPLPVSWYQAIAENCTDLTKLELHDQALDKAKIAHIATLVELEELKCYSDTVIADTTFGGPKVTAEPGDLAPLTKLKKLHSLHLSRGYRFNAADCAAISALTKLQRLEIWYAVFDPGAFSKLDTLSELKVLNLYGSRGLNTADAKAIGSLANLEELDLSVFSKAKDADFSHLQGLTKLRELDLTGFTNLTDDDMAMFTGMTSLDTVNLRRNRRVTDKGLAHLKHATKLSYLWMQHMEFKGTGFAAWPTDHGLRTAFIEGTAITGEGLQALSRLRNLEGVEIRTFRLFGGDIEVDISCFIDTPSLKYVSIIGSYRTTPEALEKLTKARPELGVFCPTK